MLDDVLLGPDTIGRLKEQFEVEKTGAIFIEWNWLETFGLGGEVVAGWKSVGARQQVL